MEQTVAFKKSDWFIILWRDLETPFKPILRNVSKRLEQVPLSELYCVTYYALWLESPPPLAQRLVGGGFAPWLCYTTDC